MIRARFAFAAALVGVGLAAGTASAQAPAAPDFKPILAGKNFVRPVRGAADLEFTKPTQKRVKDIVIDTVEVKNVSTAPIARLVVESIYYDKGGAIIAGGKGVINGLLNPGEVQVVAVESQFSTRMNSSNYKFSHANGTINPKRVDKIEDPNAPEKPAAKATAKK